MLFDACPICFTPLALNLIASPKPQPPLVRTFITGRQTLRFDYDSIELAQVEAEELLNLELPGNLRLIVLKPGYALLTLTNTLRVIPNLDEVTTWQYNDQIVKMKRSTYSDIPIRSTSPACTRNGP